MKSALTFVAFSFVAALSTLSPAQDNSPPLSITLTQIKADAWLMNRFEVMIRNTGKEDVVLLKPLDGSLWSWHLPFYRFIVKDGDNKPLKMGSRCGLSGLWGDTKWPDDYLLILKPGEQFKRIFPLYIAVPKEGEYSVQFQYVMDFKEVPEQGFLKYPNQAWNGTVSSKPIIYKLSKQEL